MASWFIELLGRVSISKSVNINICACVWVCVWVCVFRCTTLAVKPIIFMTLFVVWPPKPTFTASTCVVNNIELPKTFNRIYKHTDWLATHSYRNCLTYNLFAFYFSYFSLFFFYFCCYSVILFIRYPLLSVTTIA